jgi:hypothetical protein
VQAGFGALSVLVKERVCGVAVIVVFWLEKKVDAEPIKPVACFRSFAPNELGAALAFAEQLRRRRAAGEPVSHVTIQSELPQSAGLPGVSDPAADYSHYKRRLDPSVKLGRGRSSSGA